jgi:hypothetical protein
MLTQPGGLQGPIAVAVTHAAHDQSVAERPQVGNPSVIASGSRSFIAR